MLCASLALKRPGIAYTRKIDPLPWEVSRLKWFRENVFYTSLFNGAMLNDSAADKIVVDGEKRLVHIIYGGREYSYQYKKLLVYDTHNVEGLSKYKTGERNPEDVNVYYFDWANMIDIQGDWKCHFGQQRFFKREEKLCSIIHFPLVGLGKTPVLKKLSQAFSKPYTNIISVSRLKLKDIQGEELRRYSQGEVLEYLSFFIKNTLGLVGRKRMWRSKEKQPEVSYYPIYLDMVRREEYIEDPNVYYDPEKRIQFFLKEEDYYPPWLKYLQNTPITNAASSYLWDAMKMWKGKAESGNDLYFEEYERDDVWKDKKDSDHSGSEGEGSGCDEAGGLYVDRDNSD